MTIRHLTFLLLAGIAATSFASLARADEQNTWKNRDTFIPRRQYKVLPGKVVGVMVSNPQPVLSTEGRSSAPDVMCFSQDGLSYRWVYVPSPKDRPTITNLKVPVGKNPRGQWRLYPALDMAKLATLKPYAVTKPFVLVEVEVNDGQGSPAISSFVSTNYRVLENSKKYPLVVSNVIAKIQKDYATYKKKNKAVIDRELAKAEKQALRNRKPTGRPTTTELMYVTWMNKTNELHVRFRTKVQDGHYYYVQGGARPRPFPLPVPPGKKVVPPPPGAAPRGVPGGAPVPQPQKQQVRRAQVRPGLPGGAFPPPPPRRIKVGTTFGIEFGRAYIISKDGKVVSTKQLPFASYQNTINPPPGVAFPRRPVDPLPPAPQKIRK